MKIITKETGYHIIPSNHEISKVRKNKNEPIKDDNKLQEK